MKLVPFLVMILTMAVMPSAVRAADQATEPAPLPGDAGDRVNEFDWSSASYVPDAASKRATSARVAGVGFISQLDTGCSKGNWCCGVAATTMGTAFVTGRKPTASTMRTMYKALGMGSCCSSGTNAMQLQSLAREAGRAPESFWGVLTYNTLKDWVARGTPVVVSLRYADIKDKCRSFSGYHSLLVVGYDERDSSWLVHDPLCSSADRGAYRRIPSAQFRTAVDNYAIAAGYTNRDSVVALVPKK